MTNSRKALDGPRASVHFVTGYQEQAAGQAAFASPLLALTNDESGGLHFRGASSEGKTTALLVAATVWGEPGRLERWHTTANALEGVALAHNDNLLCLDELRELDPREAGGVAYMLANGTGKRRGQAHGGTRPRLTWRLLFLSTGEMSLEQHVAEASQRSYAGQEVRLVDIPADAGAGLGLFADLHGAPTSQAFADALREATVHHYGHAGRAFVAALAQDCAGNVAQVRQICEGFVRKQVPGGASGQVYRVAQRFGLIGAGGELATAIGRTDWPAGVALAAAARCFQDWRQQRGGVGNVEEARALRHVTLFFERYGEARFKPWTLGKGDTCERCRGCGRVDTSYKGGACFDCHGTGSITSDTEPSRQVHRDGRGAVAGEMQVIALSRSTQKVAVEIVVLLEPVADDHNHPLDVGATLVELHEPVAEDRIQVPASQGGNGALNYPLGAGRDRLAQRPAFYIYRTPTQRDHDVINLQKHFPQADATTAMHNAYEVMLNSTLRPSTRISMAIASLRNAAPPREGHAADHAASQVLAKTLRQFRQHAGHTW